MNGNVIEANFDVPVSSTVQPVEETKSKKGVLIAILSVLIVMLLVAVGIGSYVMFSADGGESKYEKLLTKAQESVDSGDYESAIEYYLQAIELDDGDADIYSLLSDAYQSSGDMEKAVAVLENGIENTDSKKLQRRLNQLNEQLAQNQNEENASNVDLASVVSEEVQATEETLTPYTGQRQAIDISVRQVDTTNFPEIALYVNITDKSGNVIEGIDVNDLVVQEISNGTTTQATMNDVYKVLNGDSDINVNLVMDASGSMSDSNKMTQAKNAAKTLVNQMDLSKGDQVEIISFDDYVYLDQEFTNNKSLLENAISNISVGGMTALYDALYSGLYQTYYEDGAKCVIGFTDGMENSSSYTYDDVVYMSKNTGIPVYIIGIGSDYDTSWLQNLANDCSGEYFSANASNLEQVLSNIYVDLYREQQDYYVVKYITKNTQDRSEFRDVELQTSEYSQFTGYYKKEYIPEADMTGAFSGSYVSKDYMISDSDVRTVTAADLSGMSLAELRIARNEIFARHGRQFKDSTLNQWFYSKTWYLNLGTKYAPDTFDSLSPSPLTKLEIDNANFIKDYEQNIMDNQDIYPDAAYTLLSEYDLALSKTVLKAALAQMQTYPSTSTLEENKRLVQEAIDKEDVRY
jgi:VWFA-related protein